MADEVVSGGLSPALEGGRGNVPLDVEKGSGRRCRGQALGRRRDMGTAPA